MGIGLALNLTVNGDWNYCVVYLDLSILPLRLNKRESETPYQGVSTVFTRTEVIGEMISNSLAGLVQVNVRLHLGNRLPIQRGSQALPGPPIPSVQLQS